MPHQYGNKVLTLEHTSYLHLPCKFLTRELVRDICQCPEKCTLRDNLGTFLQVQSILPLALSESLNVTEGVFYLTHNTLNKAVSDGRYHIFLMNCFLS